MTVKRERLGILYMEQARAEAERLLDYLRSVDASNVEKGRKPWFVELRVRLAEFVEGVRE